MYCEYQTENKALIPHHLRYRYHEAFIFWGKNGAELLKSKITFEVLWLLIYMHTNAYIKAISFYVLHLPAASKLNCSLQE